MHLTPSQPLENPTNLYQLDCSSIHVMHALRKAASIAIQAPSTSQTAFSRIRERAAVPVNALSIIAVVATLAGRLSCDNAEGLQLGSGEAVVVAVWAFVLSACEVVAAADADIMLVA